MKLAHFAAMMFATLLPLQLFAQERDSTRNEVIDSAIVTSVGRSDGISDMTPGLVRVSLEALDRFPSTLGDSNPFKFLQSFPAVSTGTDNTGGILVQGYDIGHTTTRICGAPVFGHGHILGIFSVFNPSHFDEMTFSTKSSFGNIGGVVSMDTADNPSDSLKGRFNLGPVATHFSLTSPIGKNSSLTVSARRSFVDIFYKNLLSVSGNVLDYTFYDLNAAFITRLGKSDTIDANFYYGHDDSDGLAVIEGTSITTGWGDSVGNLRWRHESDNFSLSTQLYFSRFGTDINWHEPSREYPTTSGISDFGFSSKALIGDCWHATLNLDRYFVEPQHVSTEDNGSMDSFAASLELGWNRSFSNFSIGLSAKPSVYKDFESGKLFFSPDPELSLSYDFHRNGLLKASIRSSSQNLFFLGPTCGAFPSEFWIAAGEYSDPQRSLSLNAGYDISFLSDSFKLSLETYGHRLWNQLEYTGLLTNILETTYSLDNALLKASGINYGASMMLQKTSGRLTGRLSYSAGRALRTTDGREWFPSLHERVHELNAVVAYRLGRWEFGSNAVFASGQPFTPATSVYMLDGEWLVEYGPTNSGRLKPYFRWDASVNFDIRNSGRFRDGVCVSVQNLTARHNDLIATMKIEDGCYSFSSVHLTMHILPSVNYYFSF